MRNCLTTETRSPIKTNEGTRIELIGDPKKHQLYIYLEDKDGKYLGYLEDRDLARLERWVKTARKSLKDNK